MPSPETEGTRLAHLGTWRWNSSPARFEWSPECFHAMGVDPETFVPSFAGLIDLVEPNDRARVGAIVEATLVPGGTCTFEFRAPASGATERWIRAVCVADVDHVEHVVGLHGTLQNVTGFNTTTVLAQERTERDPYLYEASTGLANWHLLADRAAAALLRAARDDAHAALLVVDLERFHTVNDRFGRQSGDRVLVEVAHRLDNAFRPYDTVSRAENAGARLAGDEFVVLCEHVPNREVAEALARRVELTLGPMFAVDGGTVQITAAIGVATGDANHGDFAALLDEACSALREAKATRRGPSQVVFAADLTDDQRAPDDAAKALQLAWTAGELVLHYQPKIDLASDRIAGAEALLRWQHPTRGLVPPNEFIPIAEETGLIVPIGGWVIEEACREGARWNKAFPDRPRLVMSVNVSARQFGPDLVGVVERALAGAYLEPASLRLEMTESLLMEDVEATVGVLLEIARLGVTLSIDDFGTGFSSLSYLQRFPLHELKIDKTFVDGLADGVGDRGETAIASAVVALAHALGLIVVAEGVESESQVERLRVLGCEQAQGYYFARPGPAEAVLALLQTEADDSWRAHRSQRPESADGASSFRAERVLVVDDAADVRLLARMSLAAVGFDVYEASDGETALAEAAQMLPDCVVLDLSMPDMHGLEICRILRSRPATAEITILVVTSHDTAAEKIAAFSAGADDYIVKPFSPRDLSGRVRAAMRRRKESRPADAAAT